MRHFLSITAGSIVLAFSLTSVAGDCNKTVMGGGCTGQVEGVSPHMQTQNPLNTVTKVKAATAAPGNAASGTKSATPAKNVKVSNVAGQKPQI